MSKKDDNVLPAHGPKHEGVDPLTTSDTAYGEDVKGASTFGDTDTTEDDQLADKTADTVADQKAVDADTTPASK